MNPFLLLSPLASATLRQHTRLQHDFPKLRSRVDVSQEQLDYLHLKKSELEDDSIPEMLRFAWLCTGNEVTGANVEVAEHPDFSGQVMHFAPRDNEQEALVHSLKTDTLYYWRVSAREAAGNMVCSETATFRTADEVPRWIFLEGVPNVRDLGGWKTKDGRRVRQGLVYRGGELSSHNTATPAGLRFAKQELALRTDLDLRGQPELDNDPTHGSPLLPEVRWVNLPIHAYDEINTPDQLAVFAKIFRVLLDSGNFPIYMHCWGGADRTGTLALLLNAVLGVSDEDLLLDYELTALATWGARSRNSELFLAFDKMLDSYAPGQDYQAKAFSFWLAAGVSEAEIEAFRELFLEPK